MSNSSTISKIKVRAYDIATGPLHNDYGLRNSNGRIFLDIRMSQILKITIKPLNLTAEFKNALIAPLYCYNLNVVVS